MKILYIAPENTVGTLNVWKGMHEKRGNQCDFITLYRSAGQFDPGICLDLPFVWANSTYMNLRHQYYKASRGPLGDYQEKDGFPPVWEPSNIFEGLYFKVRDWAWSFRIEPAIERYNLFEYDLIHLEWGLEFYRDGRLIDRLHKKGIPVVCTYHGQDMRTRGVIRKIDEYSSLNLTSELDLLEKHPNLKYLFLPFETDNYKPNLDIGDKIRICHSPTNRYYKGSESIIPACEKLANLNEDIEFILIENMTNQEAREIKSTCDILIDQVHNRGGWGYGMNSVEAMAMGLCCMTEMNEKYQSFLPNNPFVNTNGESLFTDLEKLVKDRQALKKRKELSRSWVVKHHGSESVGNVLYKYYEEHLQI